MSIIPQSVTEFPWRVLGLLAAIALFGTLVLYSAAGGSITPWAINQGVRFVIFAVMALVLSRIPLELFARFAFPAYGAVLVSLVLVELIGGVAGGSQRWINLGFMQLQPSEFMKPIIVLAVARFYAMLPVGEIRRWNAIWPALVLIGVPWALVLVQPDLGTATMILAGGITVMFLAGLPLRLVIGSGGIWGKGFLQGTQSHLQYLPEGHTDFVFATMAEEWGMAGGVFLIGAFMLLFRWGIRVSLRTPDKFARLVAAGLTTTIFFYMAINLMMVMGLAPVVGIPLPFMSYGGSSMLTVMLCVGIIMSIDRSTKRTTRIGNWA